MTNPYEPTPHRDWRALAISTTSLILALACLCIIATN